MSNWGAASGRGILRDKRQGHGPVTQVGGHEIAVCTGDARNEVVEVGDVEGEGEGEVAGAGMENMMKRVN